MRGTEGGENRIHVVDQELCIKCGTCYEACPEKFGAIRALVGEPVPPPIPEEERTIERSGKRAGYATQATGTHRETRRVWPRVSGKTPSTCNT